MDASEVIRRRLQSATYATFIQTLQSKQAGCTSTSCNSVMTTCLRNFSSYEQRDNVMNGAKICIPCSTICGTTTSITS